jgi:C-terminal processing protease CtpA/Prc
MKKLLVLVGLVFFSTFLCLPLEARNSIGIVVVFDTVYEADNSEECKDFCDEGQEMVLRVKVYEVLSGSEAEEAGLREGDEITAINGQFLKMITVEELDDLYESLQASDDEQGICFTILRQGEQDDEFEAQISLRENKL